LHEESNYPTFACTEKLGRYSRKLSIISKQNRLMHNELIYQAKIQAIFEMLRKEKKIQFHAISPQIYIYIFKKTKTKNMLYGNNIIK
jgi:hypothetical protein